MLFNSFEFLLFFPLVTLLYFLLPHKYRWFHLLMASCYFYMAFVPVYILILGFTIVIDYCAGLLIERAQGATRKRWLIVSLIANIGVLAVFKYYNFFNHNISGALNELGMHNHLPYLSILLPIGLSFHTFQAMSYTIEVYRGHQEAERHFGIYALYVMFYPQLVAGPIERPQNMIHQFHERKTFDYSDAASGLKLMAWGFLKKVVIADQLAYMVNIVYDNPHEYQGLPLILATIFFSFQIYCDFSGYSDIAIGAARVMGFKLMRNFNYPYFSASISEFWSRWHISLSTWFKDYLYIPLGGNRVAVPRWYFNLFVVFLISGIWHGANWTFVIWGALHGTMLVAENMKKRFATKNSITFRLPKFINILITFSLVSIAWIFFRADTISNAFYIVKHLFTGLSGELHTILDNITSGKGVIINTSLNKWTSVKSDYFWSLGLILFLISVEYLNRKKSIVMFISERPFVIRYFIYLMLILGILFFQKSGQQQFIYFQF
ncbi:MAG: poly(beta-D-mannuronate) O-acetylase [Bacteroidetes bacterium]|nr:poly(beta-D-mannuronate) O-acetylase [Bacteroidota bacterium]